MTDIELYRKVKPKISFKKVADLINFQPHDAQKQILDLFESQEFNAVTMVCGRRFGKSMIISVIAAGELLVPNASVLIVTPTYSNAKNMYENIERHLLKLGITPKIKDTKSLTFTLDNNARIVVATPKSISNVLGFKYSLVIFDEGQDISNLIDLYENYIQPAMSDYGVDEHGYSIAKAVFIGTARDKSNDLYLLTKRANNPKYKGWIHFTFPTWMNPWIPKDFLEQKKKELDPVVFGREYEGKWSDMDGERIYYAFSTEHHVIPHSEALKFHDRNNVHIVGIDIGFTDNTAFLIARVEPLSGRIVVLDEYAESGKSIEDHVKAFRDLEKKYTDNEPIRFIDPSAKQVQFEMAYNYDYVAANALNEIDAGVQVVNQLFYQKKLVISDNCQQLIDEIENLYWQNPATKTVKRTNRFKHFDLSLATLRYMVFSWNKQQNLRIETI